MDNTKRLASSEITASLVNLKQLIFEVTDACNLNCKYCGFGDIYYGFEKRESKFLDINKGKALIDYLVNIWNTSRPRAKVPMTFISFYGGEPLLNVPYIKAIVEYVESKKTNREFTYSMTTNGTLLDKHMDYLVAKGFKLLISLDGEGDENGYRVTASGNSSFERVFNNAKALQKKYPEYFKNNVNFNTVLHSKNNVESVTHFIKKEFDKIPAIAELNSSHVRPEKKSEFDKLFKDKYDNIYRSTSKASNLSETLFLQDPRTRSLLTFLREQSGNIFDDYEDLLKDPENCNVCPTGTCSPFSRKMFLTVHGKILQCEKIDHNYALGHVSEENEVILDIDKIAKRINDYYDKLQPRCSACAKKAHCSKCMYFIEDLQAIKPSCPSFMNQNDYKKEQSFIASYLLEKPWLYNELLNNVYLD